MVVERPGKISRTDKNSDTVWEDSGHTVVNCSGGPITGDQLCHKRPRRENDGHGGRGGSNPAVFVLRAGFFVSCVCVCWAVFHCAWKILQVEKNRMLVPELKKWVQLIAHALGQKSQP